MSFSFLRFGQLCDFHPKVYFSRSGSKRFEILPFSSSSLTPSKGLFFRIWIQRVCFSRIWIQKV
ncbi:hypothetical protein Hanom_Chr13g01222201 [Helianthus anomalus]